MSAVSSDVAATPSGRRLIWIAFAVVAALALGAGLMFGSRIGESPSSDALFAVTLPDADGRPQALGQWKGKVLIVNFWATWCAPCREEMPEFVRMQKELGARGVQFVGIAADDAVKVRAFARDLDLNYPALIGGFGAVELSKVYGNRLQALPFTLVLDRDGRIVHTQLGPLPEAKLRSVIDAAL